MPRNEKLVYDYLNEFTEHEKIFREYYGIRNDPEELARFAERFSRQQAIEDKLIFPELYPESFPGEDYFSDDRMFRSGQNVRIAKHDRYTPPFYHYHDFFEMNYVLKGSCVQQIEGRTLEFKEGDFCFLALRTRHTLEVFRDDSIVLDIALRHDTFDDIFMSDLRSRTILTTFFLDNLYQSNKTDYILFRTGDDAFIRGQILDMFLESLAEDQYSDRRLAHMTSLLFISLLRGYEKTAVISEKSGVDFREQIRIAQYLQENFRTATLESTAEHFGYSTVYCSRLIKKTTGSTFVELLREIRMKQAERLLRATPASLESIADRVGYGNASTFIRVFRQSRGMTPSQYRERNCP